MLTQAFLATIFVEVGREEEARAVYERLLSSDLADVPYDFAWLPVIALGAAVAARLGDRRRADGLIRTLAPYRDRYVDMGSSWLGSTAHYLGLLHACRGGFDQAEECLLDAAAAHQAAGSGAWLARTKLELARVLRERGLDEDLIRAAELSGEAVESARSLGLGGVLRHAGAQGAQGTLRAPP